MKRFLAFYRDWLIFPTWVLIAGACWLWPHTIGGVVGMVIVGALVLVGVGSCFGGLHDGRG